MSTRLHNVDGQWMVYDVVMEVSVSSPSGSFAVPRHEGSAAVMDGAFDHEWR